MSLLIKGLHKPINCRECRAVEYDKLAHCSKWWELNFKESDCPLIEVIKPHGDLLDRNDLLDEINLMYPINSPEYSAVFDMIVDMDAVIERE